ncbi:hypothetical protein PFFVO_00824 [Plasmodium falciparum Vietnam Oak-Knoll (FVO)]|uniref:Uncharacterized protein n=1 Tax=Plasmodium falciparum Vietnam Oak-Knoll (FVO) TaxID=1036723 RepID=A0A024VD14_PLAFA|nr:hypothetical protein PFFVO_00824 [Plasmodium falciparum Vietnam Oak-Knoll (FVO)]
MNNNNMNLNVYNNVTGDNNHMDNLDGGNNKGLKKYNNNLGFNNMSEASLYEYFNFAALNNNNGSNILGQDRKKNGHISINTKSSSIFMNGMHMNNYHNSVNNMNSFNSNSDHMEPKYDGYDDNMMRGMVERALSSSLYFDNKQKGKESSNNLNNNNNNNIINNMNYMNYINNNNNNNQYVDGQLTENEISNLNVAGNVKSGKKKKGSTNDDENINLIKQSLPKGIYYDHAKKLYRVQYIINNSIKTKGFSVKKLGLAQAKIEAESFRNFCLENGLLNSRKRRLNSPYNKKDESFSMMPDNEEILSNLLFLYNSNMNNSMNKMSINNDGNNNDGNNNDKKKKKKKKKIYIYIQ